MSNTLLNNPISVPLRIDALWSDGTTNLSPPTSDFSQLSKSVPTDGGFSNTEPWLGDTVNVAPNSSYLLPAGLHLHWTLPDALRNGQTTYIFNYTVFNELIQQGVPCALVQQLQQAITLDQDYTLDQVNQLLNSLINPTSPPLPPSAFNLLTTSQTYKNLISSDPNIAVETYVPSLQWDSIFLALYGSIIVQTAAQMVLPPVPNRWLVIREDMSDSSTTAWVIESDRLTEPNPDGTAPTGAGPSSIPGQFNDAFITGWSAVTLQNAYNFLGFCSGAQNWNEDSSLNRLIPLTAAGHGNPEFSSFYSNCQGVFGFYDATAIQDTHYQYTVIGWFADPENDPLSASYAVEPLASKVTRENRPAALGWTISSPDWNTIDGSVYTARITVLGSSCEVQSDITLSDTLNVSIGNTPGEALSAYLASDSTQTSLSLTPESILNAAQAGVLAQALEPDGTDIIENALHSQAFQSTTGGWVWSIDAPPPQQPGLSPPTKNIPVSLPDSLAQLLNALNEAQFAFDDLQREQQAQRHLVFTDWCRTVHLGTDVSPSSSVFPNGGTPHNTNGSQIVSVSANVINTSVPSVQQASVGQAQLTNMLIYQASEALYLAYAAVLVQLNTVPAYQAYLLKRQPAPRFWRPNDPAIMMVDESGAFLQASPPSSLPYTPVQNKQYLTLSAYTPTGSSPTFLPASWDNNNAVPSGNAIAGIMQSITDVTCAQSWRPLFLYWEAYYYPFPGTGSIQPAAVDTPPFTVVDYEPTFITGQFMPDPAGIELIPQAGVVPISTALEAYQGRITLSPHASQTMKERILLLTGQVSSPPPDSSGLTLPGILGQGETKTLIDTAYDSTAVTLSQTLNGFHDRLLMLQRIAQINIFDANYSAAAWNNVQAQPQPWDAYSQSFYNEIGRQARTSPHQGDVYNPIRAGKCELSALKLVDAFGQIATWNYSSSPLNTIISQAFINETAHEADAAPAFLLPPRFAQFSRLLFRWLAADGSNDVESNQFPATTPVCGWLVLNYVDETVMIFAEDGTLIGWVPDDGGPIFYLPGRSASDIQDPFLQQVVAQLEIANTFYDDVANALLTIEPRAHRQHVSRSVLESRPLALARASIELQLYGVPAPHQGYEALATMTLDVSGNPVTGPAPSPFVERETCGFTQVEFPIRLGDVSMDDDGLVAYWSITNNTISSNYTLVSTDADIASEPTISILSDPAAPITQVLVLMDPRAPIHITSGVLPVKAISIPATLYTASLKQMEYLMQVSPVLIPNNQTGMPLPAETNNAWSWLTINGNSWNSAVTPNNMDNKMHPMTEPAIIQNGYLKVDES